MSQYAENNLGNDETLIVAAKKTPKCLIPQVVGMAIILAIAIVLTVFYGAANLFKSTTYSVYRTAATMVVDEEVMKGIDSLTDEEQQFLFKLSEASSRSEYREKMIDSLEKEYEKQSVEIFYYSLDVNYGIKKAQVILRFFLPIITTTLWASYVMGILIFCSNVLKFLSMELVVTNKRVFGRIGMFRRISIDIYIDKVNQVEIKETFMGNLLNYASILVKSNVNEKKKKDDDVFAGISNAKEIKDRVMEMIEQHAQEARKKQAQELAQIISNQEPQN